MNYIRQLSAALEKIDADSRITPFHISLYLALFRRWNLNFFRNPVSVSRDELMKQSKIGSVNTYIKCLKELDAFGYIQYKPSFNRHRGSLVYLFTFDNSSVQDVIPFKNNTNNTNMDQQAKIDFEKTENPEKMKENEMQGFGPGVPPSEIHVKIYFDEKGYPPVEAEKFFNYFQSNGWLVGGRSKMKDWKAAARNWILNAQKFSNNGKKQRNSGQNPKPGNLQSRTNKDYSEPL
jgi:hypothetical protein